jgi:uncharacterized protein
MVFKRRETPPFYQRMVESFYPRKGWRRPFEYLGHRVRRLPDTPHRIALGVAIGVFTSFSPIFGFHFVIAAALALLLRGNIIASLLGTFFGNPITFPFIAAISLGSGRELLGMHHPDGEIKALAGAFSEAARDLWRAIGGLFGRGYTDWVGLEHFFHSIFVPYLLGGTIFGIITGIAFYFLSRPVIAAYQNRRRSRLLQRAKARLAAKARLELAKKASVS